MDDMSPAAGHATLDTVQAAMEELKTVAGSLAATADISQQVMQRLEATQQAAADAAQATAENRRYGHVNRAIGVVAVLGFVLDIALTGWLYYSSTKIRDNTNAIEQVEVRTSDQVLCPLYELLVSALKLQPFAPPNQTAAQATIRQEMNDVVNSGYSALHCPTS